METTLTRNLLVIDEDLQFIQKLKLDEYLKTSIVPLILSEVHSAINVINDASKNLIGVFISTSIKENQWLNLIETTVRNRPGVPLYLIRDQDIGLSENELSSIGIRQSVSKSTDLNKMIELISPLEIGFDTQKALQEARKNHDKTGVPVESSDSEFSPILAENFLSGAKSLFDVYVKISESRFIKILQAGDAFDVDRLESYLQKKVYYFYIKKSIQETYLKYCQHLTSRILGMDKVSLEVKTNLTLNQGLETANFLKSAGISEEQIKHAVQFTENAEKLVRQINPTKHKFVSTLLNDLDSYGHSVATSMIASLVIGELNVDTAFSLQVLGVASFLHDIGLQKLPKELHDEDESKMSKEQIYRYYAHPEEGAKLLSNVKGIDPMIAHTVAYHHVRKNGKGFPKTLGAAGMTQLAETLAISEEFSRLIQRKKTDAEFPFEYHVTSNLIPAFSKSVAIAFLTIFKSFQS